MLAPFLMAFAGCNVADKFSWQLAKRKSVGLLFFDGPSAHKSASERR